MESAQPTSDRPGGTPPSVFDSLVGIFLDPGTTFRKINHAPVWFIPCLALVLLALCSTYLIVEGIGYENLVRRQIEKSPFTADMSKEQKEEAIEGALASPAGRSMALIGPILFPVTLLLTAGILMLILMVLGHAPGFAKLFSVTVHSFWAYSVIGYALAVAVISLAQDPASLDVSNLVQSHLGAFVDAAESPVLFTLAASLDLLTFYNLFLLSLGVSVICGRRAGFGTGLGAVLVLWALWVITKAGFALLRS